ncbi:putative phage abortive infection protein [Humitalea rosea]|uniref:putative phage abortive infection protein n=1 Tax=Humitalea rosea TaxID=990373 RepID=UPI0011B799DB|nr:putative phage abortive infection protein [Humitalea rosea]
MGWFIAGSGISDAGTWGDSFGAFNALFGALGFAAIFATLLVQGRAIKAQQDEQNRENFERKFFELLAIFQRIREDVRFMHTPEYQASLPDSPRSVSRYSNGIDAIQAAVLEIKFWENRDLQHLRENPEETLREIYSTKILRRHESRLSPYFRTAYIILNRIKYSSALNDEERIEYANLFRGQLTSYEIILMAVNGLAPVSRDFSELLTHFHMLKYLSRGRMQRNLERIYPKQAFSPRS